MSERASSPISRLRAVGGVLVVALLVLAGCGSSSGSGGSSASDSTAACPALSASSTASTVAEGGAVPAAPSTAMEIAALLPAMPSVVDSLGDTWSEGGGSAPHVLTAAVRAWAVRMSDATGWFASSWPEGGVMHLRIYDSPAARLAAQQSIPAGVYEYTNGSGGAEEQRYHCFADCGPVSLEADALSSEWVFRAWVDTRSSPARHRSSRSSVGARRRTMFRIRQRLAPGRNSQRPWGDRADGRGAQRIVTRHRRWRDSCRSDTYRCEGAKAWGDGVGRRLDSSPGDGRLFTADQVSARLRFGGGSAWRRQADHG